MNALLKASSLASTGQATAPRPTSAFAELSPVDEDIRSRMIAEAAYYRAEARGFATGYEMEDWLAAEAEIDESIPPSAVAAFDD